MQPDRHAGCASYQALEQENVHTRKLVLRARFSLLNPTTDIRSVCWLRHGPRFLPSWSCRSQGRHIGLQLPAVLLVVLSYFADVRVPSSHLHLSSLVNFE